MFGRRAQSGAAVAAVSGAFGCDLERCLERVEYTVGLARARGARLVVFPEATLGGYSTGCGAASPALPRDGEHVARLAAIAGPTVVCVGYTEAGSDGGVYSSAACVSGDGLLGHHRKVHIPPAERGVLTAGEGFSTFDTPAGRVGMLLCYDKVFPEAARALSLDGAEVIASMAAWPLSRERASRRVGRDPQVRHFNLLDQARALENQVVWLSSNQCGRIGELRFPGQAKVVDPGGRVLASTRGRAGVALAGVDALGSVSTARRAISHLGDRRPDAYSLHPGVVTIPA